MKLQKFFRKNTLVKITTIKVAEMLEENSFAAH